MVNTTTASDFGKPNERSLYALPGGDGDGSSSTVLVQLLRASTGTPDSMLASVCELKGGGGSARSAPSKEDGDEYVYSCRPGTGAYMFNSVLPRVESRQDGEDEVLRTSDPLPYQNCDWSEPVFTSIPDSHSRTCVAPLQNGTLFMVGAQLAEGRGGWLALSSGSLSHPGHSLVRVLMFVFFVLFVSTRGLFSPSSV